MINIKKMAFLFIGIVFNISAIAQSLPSLQNDYVVLTKKISQLNVIMTSSTALKAYDGENFGEFQVIICGETVKALSDEKTVEDIKAKAEIANIKIVICGFSLDSFQMDREAVSSQLEIVDNGLLYNFQLQKKGFISIEL